MKFFTIILAAAFLGIVCVLGPAGGLPHHLRQMRLIHDPVRGGLILHHPGESMMIETDTPSGELRELKKRDAALRDSIREAESALRKVDTSERYLQSRLKTLKKERGSHRRFDSNGESQERVILHHLKALEAETAVFRRLIEELDNEQMALKIKMDLWSVESKKIAIINLLEKKGERSPLDDLSEEAKESYPSGSMAHGITY